MKRGSGQRSVDPRLEAEAQVSEEFLFNKNITSCLKSWFCLFDDEHIYRLAFTIYQNALLKVLPVT